MPKISDVDNIASYILIACTTEGEPFVSCAFHENYKNEMAQLVAFLHAGVLNSHCLVALQECCNNEKEFEEIGKMILAYIQQYAQSYNNSQNPAPVVDPCCVFKASDKNEFKG